MLRHLRHGPLTGWLIILVLMSGLTIAAYTRGSSRHQSQAVTNSRIVPPPSRSSAAQAVELLSAESQEGEAAGTDRAALTTWAKQVANVSAAGAAARQADGVSADDQMLTTFNAIGTLAATLQAKAGDPVAAAATRTAILLDVTDLQNLVAGLPVPPPANVAGDPLTGPTTMKETP